MESIIRIEAKCPFFEINELIPEKNCVRRLEGIKKNFEILKARPGNFGAKLKVTTTVVNPELISAKFFDKQYWKQQPLKKVA